MKNHMRSKRSSGFTLVEVLATVAIIVILLAVSAVAVAEHIDVLKITEMDNAARDIYMAAENRAVLLSGAQRLNDLVPLNEEHQVSVVSASTPEQAALAAIGENDESAETLYFVSKADLKEDAKDLLIDGSIDPALMDGDFYIVYDMAHGSVREVFYAEDSEAFETLIGTYGKNGESDVSDISDENGISSGSFSAFYKVWSDSSRDDRLKWKNGIDGKLDKTLVGRYSGEADGAAPWTDDAGTDIQEKPYINVAITNKEELTVTVTVKWDESIEKAVVHAIEVGKLTVTLDNINLANKATFNQLIGTSDGRVRGVEVADTENPGETKIVLPQPDEDNNIYTCTWVLDSLTGGGTEGKEPLHFQGLGSDIAPGKDFTVKATIEPVETNGEVLLKDSFIKAEAEATSNSLFEYWDGSNETEAHIAYLRHLQNLSTSFSGVNKDVEPEDEATITSAVQTAHIWGDGNGGVDWKDNGGTRKAFFEGGYPFVPIVNGALTSYSGLYEYKYGEKELKPQYEIRNLKLKADADAGASVGLFETVKGTEEDKVKLSDIRMVNTTVSGTTNGTVGALAGTANGVNITDCWVYWDAGADGIDGATYQINGGTVGGLVGTVKGDTTITRCRVYWVGESDKLKTVLVNNDGNYHYQLTGKTVGGLVGDASEATKFGITNSLAATLIEGETYAGGLVGQMAGGSISNSYADCYLSGEGQVAGLVGYATGVELENCYAAGFIMAAGTDDGSEKELSAGLCNGNATAVNGNVYSAMLCPGEGDSFVAPSVGLADSLSVNPDENIYYYYLGDDGSDSKGLSSEELGEDGTVGLALTGDGSVFEFKTGTTHPYNLQWDGENEDAKLEDYDYPGLKDLPHYGDWGKVAMAATQPLGMVYYEKYTERGSSSDTWYSGIDIEGNELKNDTAKKTLENDGKTIEEDGYAVVLLKGDLPDDVEQITVKYTYGSGEEEPATIEAPEEGWPQIIASDGKEYYMIPLPTELIDAKVVPDDFYGALEIKLSADADAAPFAAGKCYANLHFAQPVYATQQEAAPTNISIRTPRHLYNLSHNAGYWSGYEFTQAFNLDLSVVDEDAAVESFYDDYNENQTPIGNASNRFTGIYNGQNHTITGLNISGTSYQGLFGYVDGGTVQNVTLETGTVSGTGDNVGGIAGYNNGGTVLNCNNNGVDVTGKTNVGGIVGYNANGTSSHNEVYNCSNSATVTAKNTGDAYVGGIVGQNNGANTTVAKCTNSGAVEAFVTTETDDNQTTKTYGSYVGGIVGWNNGGKIENVTVDSTITVTGGDNVGGVVGYNSGDISAVTGEFTVNVTGTGDGVGGFIGSNENGSISGVTVKGNVSGGSSVGGVVGNNSSGTVTGCFNTSSVSSDGNNVGGIVGQNTSSGTVTGCYNGYENSTTKKSGVTVKGQTYVGGVVGYNTGGVKNRDDVDNCYNNASVTAEYTGNAHVGGIVGENNGADTKVANCVNYGPVEASVTANGTKTYGDRVGGVVGYNNKGTVESCANIGGAVNGNKRVGGVVGGNGSDSNSGTVTNCYNTGTVMGSDERIGGVVGDNKGTVQNCSSSGGTVTGQKRVGGVVGGNGSDSSSGTVKNCYNTGTVMGSDERIGGVVGNNDKGTVTSCYNTGEVKGAEGSSPGNVGGVAGGNFDTVTNCYNTGEVTGDKRVGGVVGRNGDEENKNTGAVSNCYNVGTVTANASKDTYIGGVVGSHLNGLSVENCYYLENTAKYGIGDDNAEEGTNPNGQTAPLTATDFGFWKNYADSWKYYPVTKDEDGNITDWEEGSDGKWTYTGNTEGVDPTSPWVMCVDIRSIAGRTTEQLPDGFPTYRPGLKDNLEEWLEPGEPEAPAEEEEWDEEMDIFNTETLLEYAKRVREEQAKGANGKRIKGNVTMDFPIVQSDVNSWWNKDSNDPRGSYNTMMGCWLPIGKVWNDYKVNSQYEFEFNAYLEGNGHTISGLKITNVNDANNGLFAIVGTDGVIKNLDVVVDTINGANGNTGGIAGQNKGRIENCSVVGNTNGGNDGTIHGKDPNTGGIVGYNNGGTVKNCYNAAIVAGTGPNTGGIVGSNSGTVENCHNYGAVSSTNTTGLGGVVGNNEGTVTNCYYLNTCGAYGEGTGKNASEFNDTGSDSVLSALNTGKFKGTWRLGSKGYPVLTVGEGRDNTTGYTQSGDTIVAALPPDRLRLPHPDGVERDREF